MKFFRVKLSSDLAWSQWFSQAPEVIKVEAPDLQKYTFGNNFSFKQRSDKTLSAQHRVSRVKPVPKLYMMTLRGQVENKTSGQGQMMTYEYRAVNIRCVSTRQIQWYQFPLSIFNMYPATVEHVCDLCWSQIRHVARILLRGGWEDTNLE